jgi:hypothetical protein
VNRAGAVVVAGLVTVTILVAVFVEGFVRPVSDAPAPEGPVVVLGGSRWRVAAGMALLPDPSADRPLVLSHSSIEHYIAAGGSCRDAHVVCVRPQPATTLGEARWAASFLEEGGWSRVTVVTDRFHLTRSRVLFGLCVGEGVRMVDTDRPPRRARLRVALWEAAATAASLVAYRGC